MAPLLVLELEWTRGYSQHQNLTIWWIESETPMLDITGINV
jgi:hypothetical protein